jgi:accessory Sec system glycosyltransferase GtfB
LHKRLVKIVDWLDERGVVRSSDHYNRYGALYARTIFNKKGLKVNRAYFNEAGQEVLVENFVTGDIIANGDQVRIFHTRTDFVCHFLKSAGLSNKRLFYNSLSTPFFVSQKLGGDSRGDVLFWQEAPRDDIPGNMKLILGEETGRTGAIMVQKQGSYERLIELGANPAMLHKLGFVYPFARANRHGKDILICTNSDRVAHLYRLAGALPDFHFHVVALTEMSAKLISVGNCDNVSLYPGIRMERLDELFDRCDLYLDINYESEIVSAVYRAFLQNQLIFAFRETLHRADFVPGEHCYDAEDPDSLAAAICSIWSDELQIEAHLQAQRDYALAEEPSAYNRCDSCT